MISRSLPFSTITSLLLSILLLSACITGTKSNTLYTLYPPKQERMGNSFADFREMILIMPIRLAPQLQGRGIITQRSETESKTAANHLWSGPLDQQIADNIASSLKELLSTDNIAVYPGPRFGNTHYQVEVEISEFSGNGQLFTLRAVYTLSDTSMKTVLVRKSFHQTRNVDKSDHSGYVSAASLTLGDLSKEIAAALLKARQIQPATPVVSHGK